MVHCEVPSWLQLLSALHQVFVVYLKVNPVDVESLYAPSSPSNCLQTKSEYSFIRNSSGLLFFTLPFIWNRISFFYRKLDVQVLSYGHICEEKIRLYQTLLLNRDYHR